MLKGLLKNLALFFFLSFIVLIVGVEHTVLSVYDEGIIAHGALRVFNGEVPYRDFWELYGPAQFWIIAALYKVFGVSLLTERVWDAFIRAMIGLFTYLVASRLASKPLALIAWILSVAWLLAVGFYGLPLLPTLLFVLISAYFFIAFLSEPAKTRLLFLSGFTVGISACFRHDIGTYAIFAEGALLLVQYLKSPNSNTPDHAAAASGFMKNISLYFMGVALIGVPVAFYLLWKVPFPDLWEQFFIYPLTVYPYMRYLPYPSILEPFRSLISNLNGYPMLCFCAPLVDTIPFYFPFFVLGTAGFLLIKTWLMERHSGSNYWDHKRLSILFFIILTGFEFIKSLLRPSYVNLTHVIVLSLILSVIILDEFRRTHRKTIICVGLSLVAMAFYLLGTIHIDVHELFPQRGNQPPRAWNYRIEPDQAAAIKFIQEHVPENQKIFVGNARHDKVSINDAMFYFLAERRSATKFDLMAPGQVTTAEVQNQIINELIDNRIQYVVLVTEWDNSREPNKSSESSGIKLLDDFLSAEYTEVVRFGGYTIREKTAGNTSSTLK
jgi:hypothetical protein